MLADYAFTRPEAARLEELRLAATEARIDAGLALGRHDALTAELEELVAGHPLRERLHGQLILALYRCGRQADALAAYRRVRDLLAGELGIDPGEPLRRLHASVLAQDPALDWHGDHPTPVEAHLPAADILVSSRALKPPRRSAAPGRGRAWRDVHVHAPPGNPLLQRRSPAASDIRRGVQRQLINGPAVAIPNYYDGIPGASACRQHPRRCDLSSGIVTDDAAGTVTFHLAQADPDFLYKLAGSFVAPASPGTPDGVISRAPFLPGTGPYMISRFRPNESVTLVRNPYFRQWSYAVQPAGYPSVIRYECIAGPNRQESAVDAGRADLVLLLAGIART